MKDDLEKLEELEARETQDIREKLNLETARIAWTELQGFFASGNVIEISAELDLVEIAAAMAADNSGLISPLVEAGKISAPSDERALDFHNRDAVLWAVVVRPWILVQDRE